MRCKRCGTPIQALDHLCQGCGKSIIALREDNEIIYNDSELSQVEIEKMNKKEEPIKQEIEEVKNDSLDIFGDAVFNNEIKQDDVSIDNFNSIIQNNQNVEPIEIIEEVIEPIQEEIINSEKITNSKIVEEPIEIIEEVIKPIQEITNKEKIEEIDKQVEIVDEKTLVKEPKKVKKITLVLVIIAFVLLIIAGIFLYFYSLTSPSRIFNLILNKLESNPINLENARIETSLNLKVTNENSELDKIINNLTINAVSHSFNEKTYLKLNPLYNNKSLIDMDMYLEKEELNLYLNGIYDKYITITKEDGFDFELNVENQNTEVLLEELKKEIQKSLNSKYLNHNILKIDNEYMVKSIFTLDNTNYNEFFNNLKNNEKFIDSLSKITKLSIEQTKEILMFKTNSKLEIILYTKLFNVELTKIEINSEQEGEKYNLTVNINDNKYDFIYKDLNTNEQRSGYFKIEKTDLKTDYIFSLENITFNFSVKVMENHTLNWPIISDKVLMRELTEEDFNNMSENFMNNENIIEIGELLASFFGINLEEPNEEIDNEFLEE